MQVSSARVVPGSSSWRAVSSAFFLGAASSLLLAFLWASGGGVVPPNLLAFCNNATLGFVDDLPPPSCLPCPSPNAVPRVAPRGLETTPKAAAAVALHLDHHTEPLGSAGLVGLQNLPMCVRAPKQAPEFPTEKTVVSGFWHLNRTKGTLHSYLNAAKNLMRLVVETMERQLLFYHDETDTEVAVELQKLARTHHPSVTLHHAKLTDSDFYADTQRVGSECALKAGGGKNVYKGILRKLGPIWHNKFTCLEKAAREHCEPDSHCKFVVWVDLIKKPWVAQTVLHTIEDLDPQRISTMQYGPPSGSVAWGYRFKTMGGYLGVPVGMVPQMYTDYLAAIQSMATGTCFDEEVVLTKLWTKNKTRFAHLPRADSSRHSVVVTAVSNAKDIDKAINTIAHVRKIDFGLKAALHVVLMYPLGGELTPVLLAEAFSCYNVTLRGVSIPANVTTANTAWWKKHYPKTEDRWQEFLGFYAFDPVYFGGWTVVIWIKAGVRVQDGLSLLSSTASEGVHGRLTGFAKTTLNDSFPTSSEDSKRLHKDLAAQLNADQKGKQPGTKDWFNNDVLAFKTTALDKGNVESLFKLQRTFPSGSGMQAFVNLHRVLKKPASNVFDLTDKHLLPVCHNDVVCGLAPLRCNKLLQLFICPGKRL